MLNTIMQDSIRTEVTFRHEKGMHARVAAMVVHKAGELQNRFDVIFKVKKVGYSEVPLDSILLLVELRIKANDVLELVTYGEAALEASEEMRRFLEGGFSFGDPSAINKIDDILQNNLLTADNIFKHIANGLVVINEKEDIIMFNNEAERIFGMSASSVIGKKILDVLPNSRLPQVVKSLKSEIAYTNRIGQFTVVSNTTPILIEQSCKGAISIFEDITKLVHISWELNEIKELKEKYHLILETVQDGICVTNQEGVITYINAAYQKICGETYENLIGKNVMDIAPHGNRAKVLASGQKIIGGITTKSNGIQIIANVTPIVVDGRGIGVLSVMKDITAVKELVDKLHKVSAKAAYLEEELIRTKKIGPAFDRIIGTGGKIMDAMAIASKAAGSRYTVMINGESGTGKELMAEAIHYSSDRATEPFIRVNCAAIPPTLMESELFGHEKGAFTGAYKTKYGKFELANNGTIFLDEIGEMDRNMQVKLLRVVQNREFQRVGGEETIQLDIRIIAATNRRLEDLVKEGSFREDLYYRLNVIPILLPPLRERREDIPVLVETFTKRICEELSKKTITYARSVMDALASYPWPGNIRELENLLERTLLLLEGDVVTLKDLPSYVIEHMPAAELQNAEIIDVESGDVETWETYEKRIIEHALIKYGSCNAAGKALGINHKTVSAKAKKYHLI
jgi:PAS domain S-box-containing protein